MLSLLLPPADSNELERWMHAKHQASSSSWADACGEIARGYAEILALVSMGQLSDVDRQLAYDRIVRAARRAIPWLSPSIERAAQLVDPSGDRPISLVLAELCLREQGAAVRWVRTPRVGTLTVIDAPLIFLDRVALDLRVRTLRSAGVEPIVVRTDFSALGLAAACRRAA
jgi:hypothetical protein